VGDVVHLSCDEMIPADILLLRSSDDLGLCYIDTQNLDGEANLKQREVPRCFAGKDNFQPQDFRATVECDAPTTKIYRFHGSILHPWGERVPVGKDNLLLRECVLKNTNFVEGLVVYAGHESKAMLNNGGPRYKRSKLERQLNTEVVYCVLILFVLCAIGALGSGFWLSTFEEYVPFLNTLIFSETNAPFEGFLTFWTFVIILQVIIPLSLYVTIEMTKLLQIYLIHQDADMFDELCQKKVECRALNIPEELGQVQYAFCDKTGTLTENNMVFKRCTINGIDYDHLSLAPAVAEGQAKGATPPGALRRATLETNSKLAHTLSLTASTASGDFEKAKKVQEFFLLLAVCNTVIVAKKPHVDNMTASGVVLPPSSGNNSAASTSKIGRRVMRRREMMAGNKVSADPQKPQQQQQQECDRQVTTPSPPLSLMSTASSTAPLASETSLPSAVPVNSTDQTTPARPTRLLGELQPPTVHNSRLPPLSPIASSPEATPTAENAPTSHSVTLQPSRSSKHLQIPGFLRKVVSAATTPSGSRSGTPLPTTPSGSGSGKPLYEAESPDELALVDAAHAYDIKLLSRTPNKMTLSLSDDNLLELEILHILPFDSVRKRMSVILLHPVTKEKVLYCKGADSSVFPRLEHTENEEEARLLKKTKDHLHDYARLGLRVLVMARRVIPEQEYASWSVTHSEAEVEITNCRKS